MRARVHLTVFVLIVYAAITPQAQAEDPVYFPDANLKAAVEAALAVADPAPTDMLGLESLNAYGKGIVDLTGLEYASNLWDLYLRRNEISDLSPVALLSSLRRLHLYDNNISDISPISGLTGLTELSLGANNISDISPIAGCTSLTYLDLYRNPLTDISLIAAFTHLRFLQLEAVPFTSLSPLYNLTELEEVMMNPAHLAGADFSFFGNCLNMRSLALRNAGLTDISWIAGLTQLNYLCLNSNAIQDLSPLSALTNLTGLVINYNDITDISPLSGLSNLTTLQLGGNPIGDFGLIGSLSNLGWLVLPNCGLSDLAFLEPLTSLRYLILSDNQISDISVLRSLQSLSSYVDLSRNNVSDISPLCEHTSLRQLDLSGNPLSPASYCTYLPLITVMNPGIAVYVDSNPFGCGFSTPVGEEVVVANPPITVTFAQVTGAGETSLGPSVSGPIPPAGFVLGEPPTYYQVTTTATYTGLVDISISFANLAFLGPAEELRLFHYEDGGWVDCTTTVDTQNQVVHGLVSSLSSFVILEPAGEPVSFADAKLKAAVEQALGKTNPTPADMLRLEGLWANGVGISDLAGLEYAKNLRYLSIRFGSVSDISPIGALTGMTNIELGGNPISDISPLGGLTNLRYLDLEFLPLNDISPLWGLTNLTWLYMAGNPSGADLSFLGGFPYLRMLSIPDTSQRQSDVTWIANLSQLEGLNLNGSMVEDISLLAGLQNLRMIQLARNPISDFSPLRALSRLDWVVLNCCGISDISFLEPLTSLHELTLWGNQISDISVLRGIHNLGTLDVGSNAISDISALSEHTALRQLYLWGNPMDQASYCVYLPVIQDHNPGAAIYYDANPYDCDYLPAYTPPGASVEVTPQDSSTGTEPVTITFEEVDTSGITSVTTSAAGPVEPAGFQLGDPPTYYDIATTAEQSGLIDICVSYANVLFSCPPEELRLFHYENGGWVDCTTMVDTQNQLICGVVSSLSPFAILEPVIPVSIDIKPGSYPNTFNKNGSGVIPVAILGSDDFDVTKVDPFTLLLGSMAVKVKNNGTPQCSLQDVNADGFMDLVCQFQDDASTWAEGTSTATLTGRLKTEYGGNRIEGSDEIRIVPDADRGYRSRRSDIGSLSSFRWVGRKK